jgi:hypothetical protein
VSRREVHDERSFAPAKIKTYEKGFHYEVDVQEREGLAAKSNKGVQVS